MTPAAREREGKETTNVPIYEYECADCEKVFETLVLGSERPKCPKCGGERLAKLMSASAVRTRDGGGDFSMPDMGGFGGGCGTCGDPRGPGACSM